MSNTEKIVEYWEDPYLQRYMGDTIGDRWLSQVDSAVLFEGLDSLAIKVTGEVTGIDGSDWFKSLEAPDIRNPFSVMVNQSNRYI